MILANMKCPKVINSYLWPFATAHAVNFLNKVLSHHHKYNCTPEQAFTQTKSIKTNHKFQTFGCPVYFLKRGIQNDKRIYNKWMPRSRIGAYMGQSRHHASNIALILDIHSGYISPQFHCTFDTHFQTIQDIQHIEGSWMISLGLKPGINNDETNNATNNTTAHHPTTITSIRSQNMEHQQMENEQTDNVQTPVGWRSSRKKKTT